MANNVSWLKIFSDYKILEHDFSVEPYYLSAKDIKKSVQEFKGTAEKEVRILCKQDSRKNVPQIMRDNGLILLPVKNGQYAIVQGEGYIDIPDIDSEAELYHSKLDFDLDTSIVGNSEMQHLDYAFASGIIRTFMEDPGLVLTIRGRKYTPQFEFTINKQIVDVKGVQTEVDGGYEGKDKVVLIEAKNSTTKDTIIRQLYYPLRQWTVHTNKQIFLLFFEKRRDEYLIWQYAFTDLYDYNSIKLIKSKKYKLAKKDN